MTTVTPWLPFRLAVLAFVATCPVLSAQSPKTGQVTGTVVDELGATIARASVFVHRNDATDEDSKLMTHTDLNGNFTLKLPEGGYDVLVTCPGFSARVETIAVLAHKHRRTEWKLKWMGCNFPGANCDTVQ